MAGVTKRKENGHPKRKGCRILVTFLSPFLQVSNPNPHVKKAKIER